MLRFRLQRVLELREQHEQAKARELAVAQAVAATARLTHEELSALHTASRTAVDAAQYTQPRVGHLHQLGFVLDAMEQRVDSAAASRAAADTVVDGARSALDDAARDRRVLDRLKSRHAEAARAEEVQKDRLLMDEIALGRFVRRIDAHDDAVALSKTSQSSTGGSPTRTDGLNQ